MRPGNRLPYGEERCRRAEEGKVEVGSVESGSGMLCRDDAEVCASPFAVKSIRKFNFTVNVKF